MGSKLPSFLHTCCKLDKNVGCTEDCIEVLKTGQLTFKSLAVSFLTNRFNIQNFYMALSLL